MNKSANGTVKLLKVAYLWGPDLRSNPPKRLFESQRESQAIPREEDNHRMIQHFGGLLAAN